MTRYVVSGRNAGLLKRLHGRADHVLTVYPLLCCVQHLVPLRHWDNILAVFNPYLQQVLLPLNTILQYLCSFLYFIQPL